MERCELNRFYFLQELGSLGLYGPELSPFDVEGRKVEIGGQVSRKSKSISSRNMEATTAAMDVVYTTSSASTNGDCYTHPLRLCSYRGKFSSLTIGGRMGLFSSLGLVRVVKSPPKAESRSLESIKPTADDCRLFVDPGVEPRVLKLAHQNFTEQRTDSRMQCACTYTRISK